ncbi:hypothetical protein ACIPQJ_33775 [Streptomyces sp. NPDC090082]
MKRLSEDDDPGMAVDDLIGPLLTLTVLLLAFVLLRVFSREAQSTEAP